jgi:bifunctional lysine-specific demethylase and histidyl-hydroxylase NO66
MTRGVIDAGRPPTHHGGDRPASGALGRCVGPDVDGFARECWGVRPRLARASTLPSPFTDLLDLDGVDELLSRRGLRTPFLRIARDGEVVDSRQFTGPAGAGAEIADQVRDDQVARLFADGSTVVLQGLHRVWPPIIDFVGALAAELGHPCQANAYVTPASSRGFSAHYDVHDVFVLQLAGAKHWTVHAPVHPDPLRGQPWTDHAAAVAQRAATDEPVVDAVLRPGDALYLPRGYLHAATALGEVSAHLTVGVHCVTRFALVEALFSLLGESPVLRASLPLGIDVSDPDRLAPHLAAVLDALGPALRGVDAGRLAEAVRGRVWSGGRPEPVPPLAHAGAATGLGPSDAVRLRRGLGHRLSDGDPPELAMADRTLRFPDGTRPALRALLAGAPVVVGSLPGLDDDSRLVLVRRLLREGVLVMADPR